MNKEDEGLFGSAFKKWFLNIFYNKYSFKTYKFYMFSNTFFFIHNALFFTYSLYFAHLFFLLQ